MPKIYSHTQSLCNTCRAKIHARIVEKDGNVFMEKFCPEHGVTESLISSDKDWYEASLSYVKPGQIPFKHNVGIFRGCPDSCGFCVEHQQHTCLPVIEINYDCNLNCPVCLKGEYSGYQMTLTDFNDIIDNLIATEGRVDVLNISGGEPALHPYLTDFIEIAVNKGVTQVSLSTNGIDLLTNSKLRHRLKELNIIVTLQFDSFDDKAYQCMRGTNLAQQKQELIRLLELENMNYSLVCTVVKGVNDGEVKDIADFFFRSSALTLMFQPITFTGFAQKFDPVSNRITIPDVVREIEKSQYVKKGDFNPLPCSHFSCFALSYYLKVDDNNYYSLKEFLGKEAYLNVIANKTLPGLDSEGFSHMKQRLYEFWSAADTSNLNEKVLERIKNVLKEMSVCQFNQQSALNLGKNHMKAIFIHHFMDIYNFDFSRLIKCCNPYSQPGNKLVPMCAQNVIFNK